ncbi:MAG TPA: hypothetical protein VG892_06590, partial [Terriglobales bacterium]|nr:hypothetical protein [Terriglobales bacterium]
MAALLCRVLAIPAQAAAGSAADPSADGITYTVALEDPARHLVHVTMHLPAASTGCDVLLPVWNGLYQVRDFSQYIMGPVTMTDSTAPGSPAKPQTVTRTGKSSWRVEGAHPDLDVEYRVHINVPGPFGSQLNSEHAFLNLAWILMDPLCRPAGPMSLEFARIPEHWKLITSLPRTGNRFVARSYDQMVDSPVEIGRFHEVDFKEGGASYSLAIDANPADYDAGAVTSTVRRIVTETVEWMQDRPFE